MGSDAAPSLWAVRLEREWRLLEQLAERNPDRLTGLAHHDNTFHLTLHETPALALASSDELPNEVSTKTQDETPAGPGHLVTTHALRLEFPEFFPAVPLELYLEHPVRHPNIHPRTGFVCLWEHHRVENTAALALHKTVAILGWQLHNAQPAHVMQPDALAQLVTEGKAIRKRLAAPALTGLAGQATWPTPELTTARRRRLS